MELLNIAAREFVMCRLPLSDSRTIEPAKVWHTCLVLGVEERFDGQILVTLAGTTSKICGRQTRVIVRAGTPEGRLAGANKDFEICTEWVRTVPLTSDYFGEVVSVKGTLAPRLSVLLATAVANLAKLNS